MSRGIVYAKIDPIEARLILDILKTGSRFYKEAELAWAGPDEGTFLHYDAEREVFVIRRYEVGDWILHFNGFDETLTLNEADLLRLLTGQWTPSPAWFSLSESNQYRFDFDPPPKPRPNIADAIRQDMDVRDLALLKCTACHSRRVEPWEYGASVNPGRAIRHVHLAVKCLDCGQVSVYDCDD
jgi:hypothetical protein